MCGKMCGKGQFDIGDEVNQTFDLGVLHVYAHAISEHRLDLSGNYQVQSGSNSIFDNAPGR